MWPFTSEEQLLSINNVFRKKYNEKEFIKDYYNPFIVHFPGVFKNMSMNTQYHIKYKEFASQIKEIKILKLESLKHIINYIIFSILIFCKIIINYL